MIDITQTWINAECPHCKIEIDIQLVDVSCERTIFCHNCKNSITLIDSDACAHQANASVNQALNELEQQLKNLFK